MNKYTVHVPAHVPRITLGAFVRRAFPLLPERAIQAAFAKKDVKIDGKRCGKGDTVPPGSEVTLFTPCDMSISVVYEDEYLLAVDKPAGVSCDADVYGSMTVLDWAVLHAAGVYAPRMCHRLDNPTSGLLVLAKDDQTEAALKGMFSRHAGGKEYVCIACGPMEKSIGEEHAWLSKDALHARVKVTARETPGSKEIITGYEVMENGPLALVRVRLLTGRTHQIRAHMAYLGHPVLGDDQYGDRGLNREWGQDRLMLRAVALHIDTGGEMPQVDGIQLRVPTKLDVILNSLRQKSKITD